jgi:hypothetical protein
VVGPCGSSGSSAGPIAIARPRGGGSSSTAAPPWAPPSEAARERVFARQGLPDRIRSWRAFEHGDTLIAIYLFDVTASTEPAILEEILPLDGP